MDCNNDVMKINTDLNSMATFEQNINLILRHELCHENVTTAKL